MNNNPLLDSNFLVKLNNDKNRTIYAHIISLNQYEHPIEQLEGVVTAGSITLDGESAVRRVCSLTLSAKNLNINNVYWGLTTKIKIEIGLQNNVDSRYDNIIWFPQGIFILTDFKTTQTLNNYTINLSGKDKMCMLNGDVSGNFPAPIRFDSYTDATNQSYIITSTGEYNNFIDDVAANAILEGFQEQYGSDFQFIKSAKKILSLSYIPNTDIPEECYIQFGPNSKQFLLSDLMIETKEKRNGKIVYEMNLDESDIYGFIVNGANQGDEFLWTIEQKIPISIIIREMLHQFGQERYSNIIIKDIEPYALEMLDSAFEENYYLLHDGDSYAGFVSQSDLITNYQIYGKVNKDGDMDILVDGEGNISNIIFRNYVEEDDSSLIEILSGSTLESSIKTPTKIINKNNVNIQYTLQPVLSDNVAGYGMTLLVYPDELTAQPGDSITTILDKIVDMLGDYEYFYDIKGQFVFQAKPAYVKTAWNNYIYSNNDNYIEAGELSKRVAYTFDDSTLTTQYQNTPNMNNIKNDYIIWGEKKNLSGNSVKFHGRYAIDNIPLEYTDFNGFTWTSNKKEQLIKSIYEYKEQAIKSYSHIYNYPNGAEPENTGWWEVNDWANYYQSVFGIDLSKSGNQMSKYHEELTQEQKENALSILTNIFLTSYDNTSSIRSTDVITIIYEDSEKTIINNVYDHGGTCSHYYCQFMDIRRLNLGWNYAPLALNQKQQMYKIINSWDASKVYTLDTGRTIDYGYSPDYTTSFIYRPILPNDLSIYTTNIITDIVYPDAKNKNNKKRQYALDEDVDWRHLIHIMANDWYQHHTEDDYEINLRLNNSWDDLNIDLYPYGRTGYEQYYLDFTSIGGFWQDLYDIYSIYITYCNYHPEIKTDQNILNYYRMAQEIINTDNYKNNYYSSGSYKYWNKNVVENPEKLNFWFDFFKADDMGIGKFAVSVIGDRPKTINDSAIKTIIYRDAPDVIYCTWDEYNYYKQRMVLKDGYKYIIVGDGYNFNPEDIEEILQIYNNYINEGGAVQGFIRDSSGKYLISQDDKILLTSDSTIETVDKDLIDKYNNILKKYYIDIFQAAIYFYSLTNDIKQNFVRSIRNKTVHDQADTMLYQYSYYNDTVNISSVPVYYLQPNTIISTKDELSRVTGYYVINKINISLAYNGMMQITAIKSPERIY